ncbi:hypothetical protein HK102_006700 [Quaeritorhiza haematococci]|nr:hypothetical protein HK102_006700 [Quaeritorhiza haematococci]
MSLSKLIMLNTNITTYPTSAFRYSPRTKQIADTSTNAGSDSNTTKTPSAGTTQTKWREVVLTESLKFSYLVNAEQNSIDMILESNYSGWYAVGFGGRGMSNVDIIAVHNVGNGQVGLDDMWSASFNPVTDTAASGKNSLTNVAEATTSTSSKSAFKFTRALDTGEATDVTLKVGANVMIYAWGDSWTMAYHGGNRGSKAVTIALPLTGNGTGGGGGGATNDDLTYDKWTTYSWVYIKYEFSH